MRPEIAEAILDVAYPDNPDAVARRQMQVLVCLSLIGMGLAIRRRSEPGYAAAAHVVGATK